MKKKIISISAICLLLGYIVWVLIPFDESIKVYDEVGLTEHQTLGLVEYAKSIDSFHKSTISKLKRESRFTPWSRGELFISITGTHSEVKVQSGFYGGPLYAGGRIFTAKWINGAWVFDYKIGMMWVR